MSITVSFSVITLSSLKEVLKVKKSIDHQANQIDQVDSEIRTWGSLQLTLSSCSVRERYWIGG